MSWEHWKLKRFRGLNFGGTSHSWHFLFLPFFLGIFCNFHGNLWGLLKIFLSILYLKTSFFVYIVGRFVRLVVNKFFRNAMLRVFPPVFLFPTSPVQPPMTTLHNPFSCNLLRVRGCSQKTSHVICMRNLKPPPPPSFVLCRKWSLSYKMFGTLWPPPTPSPNKTFFVNRP